MTGSPISDLVPIFMAAGVRLNVRNYERKSKTLLMNEKFFTGYRQSIVAPDEVLISFEIPYSQPVSNHVYSSIGQCLFSMTIVQTRFDSNKNIKMFIAFSRINFSCRTNNLKEETMILRLLIWR